MSEEKDLTVGEDLRRERGVFLEVLEQFPILLTVEELVRTQTTQRLGDQDPELWDQAITEVRRKGLFRLNGKVVEPTLAAHSAKELLEMRV